MKEEPTTKMYQVDPSKKYIAAINIPKNLLKYQEEICNKIELKFKANGVKNITTLPYTLTMYHIQE